MRMPWNKSNPEQLDLLLGLTHEPAAIPLVVDSLPPLVEPVEVRLATPGDPHAARAIEGLPLMLGIERLYEDADNPRTEFPEAEIEELAEDIRRHGILQPIVVHPVDATGRHQIHFGAKRWRAAQFAALPEVPVVVREASADPYAQVAENQKRHGLTPLDLARFIRGRVHAGDSNASVAKRLGMNLTTVAHHLALLDLPAELDDAMRSGRITSPRTLHELRKRHAEEPEQVRTLLSSGAEVTRSRVSALRAAPKSDAVNDAAGSPANKLVEQLNDAFERLERALSRIKDVSAEQAELPELIALRIRVEDLIKHWQQGSDRQTPPTS